MKNKNALIRWTIFAAMLLASLYFVIPPKEKVRLGLDLAGGTSFTVQIDTEAKRAELADSNPTWSDQQLDAEIDRILRDADDRTIEVLRNRIDGLGVNEPVIAPAGDHRIIIQLPGADERQRAIAEESIKAAAYLSFRLVHRDNGKLVSNLLLEGKAPAGYEIIDADGRQYYSRVRDYNKIVDENPNYARELSRFHAPAGYLFMLQPELLRDGREVYLPAFVRRSVEMDGAKLVRADIDRDPMTAEIQVTLAFNSEGAREFGAITSKYAPGGTNNRDSQVGRCLAIVLDNTLYSAPTINEPILGGRAQITGRFSMEEAAKLRNVLNAGALPAPIKVLQKTMIDSSLGADAISSGIRAACIGGILVALFMLFYYCVCGLVADVALVMNIVLLPLGMICAAGVFSALGVTDSVDAAAKGVQLPVLTMPGIAGIVLTIGMAVDANVLIFERMREEFKLGKSAATAVFAGYDRAFYAIFDSNLTTFLVAFVLFIFGSGPIRGFAITLSAGIVISMYTALVLSRMIFAAAVKETMVKPFKMREWFGGTKFDFLKQRNWACIAPLVVIIATLVIFGIKLNNNPRNVLAVDYTGGSVLTISFDQMPEIAKIRGALTGGGIGDAVIQTQSAASGMQANAVTIKTGKEDVDGVEIGQAAVAALKTSLPDSGATLINQDTIGSQIGKDLKRSAVRAVIIALVIILVYVSIRFRFGYAVGTVVALAHDVLITFGLYTLLGGQINLTIIACLLTIVGYSVNNTIVVFDRIRENLRLYPRTAFPELVNMSLNQTLARSFLTTLTTLLAALALLIFGGAAIREFSVCMCIGLICGAFSSLFIAPAVMCMIYHFRRPDNKQ